MLGCIGCIGAVVAVGDEAESRGRADVAECLGVVGEGKTLHSLRPARSSLLRGLCPLSACSVSSTILYVVSDSC